MFDQHIRARLKIIQSRNFKSVKEKLQRFLHAGKTPGEGRGEGWGKTIHAYGLYRYVPLLRDGMVFKQFSQG